MRVGSILTGKMVIYPIVDDIDGDGNQLINWMAEIKRDTFETERLEQAGRARGFLPALRKTGAFDWLDVAADDPRRRPDPRISDGGQGPGRRAGPSAA